MAKKYDDVPAGYFQFSNPMESASELSDWIEWFKSCNIKTTVIQRNNSFVLCRHGIEARSWK